MPPDLALLSTLIGSNYPCLELIFMVPKVFEPLKFDCSHYQHLYLISKFDKKIIGEKEKLTNKGNDMPEEAGSLLNNKTSLTHNYIKFQNQS